MSDIIFRRKIYEKLLYWKEHDSHDSVLMIEGPRRVGKSTLVEEFARKEYSSYLLIDFSRPKKGTIESFERYYDDSDKLFTYLQNIYGVTLQKGKSLVVFDEVQRYPKARQLIKYLVLEDDYDFIETGSLISIRENVEDIQIPSEEESVGMYPLDFEEFLWALGDESTMDLIRGSLHSMAPLGQIMHPIIMEKFRTYMLVGGMPQAVSEYVRTKDMAKVEKIKGNILKLYREDMVKIKKGNGVQAAAIFEHIPGFLSSHRKIVSPGAIKAGTDASDYVTSLYWLKESRICNLCLNSTDPNPAMNLNATIGGCKCYMCDTGLLLTAAFDSGNLRREETYQAFLKGRLSMNEGMLFENVAAQELVAAGSDLFFHEFYLKGDEKHLYEVDFVIANGKYTVPIDVKSSVSRKHRSLDLFGEKYGKKVRMPLIVHTKDVMVEDGITYLPIYMMSLIPEWIAGEHSDTAVITVSVSS